MKFAPLCFALILGACSAEPEPPAADETASTQPAEAQAPRAALTAEDIEGAGLAGELACSFAEQGNRAPLLVASADVDDAARADGVLKLGPSTLRLRSAGLGGFNAMVRGAKFASGDLTARVVVTSDTPVGGGEAPPLPARLEIETGAPGVQWIEGTWACGP